MVKVSPRKDVPFKALFTYHMLKKTGVVPEGECFDAEYFQKAPTYVPESSAAKVAFHEDLSPKNLDKDKYPTANEIVDAARRYMANEPRYLERDQAAGDDTSTAHLREISPYPPDGRVIMNTLTPDAEIYPIKPQFTTYDDRELISDPDPDKDVKGKAAVDDLSRMTAGGRQQLALKDLKEIDQPSMIWKLFEYLDDYPYEATEEWRKYLDALKEKYKKE